MSCITLYPFAPDSGDVRFLGFPGLLSVPQSHCPMGSHPESKTGVNSHWASDMMEPHSTVSSGDSEFADQVPSLSHQMLHAGHIQSQNLLEIPSHGQVLSFLFFPELSRSYFIQ